VIRLDAIKVIVDSFRLHNFELFFSFPQLLKQRFWSPLGLAGAFSASVSEPSDEDFGGEVRFSRLRSSGGQSSPAKVTQCWGTAAGGASRKRENPPAFAASKGKAGRTLKLLGSFSCFFSAPRISLVDCWRMRMSAVAACAQAARSATELSPAGSENSPLCAASRRTRAFHTWPTAWSEQSLCCRSKHNFKDAL
jgi:hypothetical protein